MNRKLEKIKKHIRPTLTSLSWHRFECHLEWLSISTVNMTILLNYKPSWPFMEMKKNPAKLLIVAISNLSKSTTQMLNLQQVSGFSSACQVKVRKLSIIRALPLRTQKWLPPRKQNPSRLQSQLKTSSSSERLKSVLRAQSQKTSKVKSIPLKATALIPPCTSNVTLLQTLNMAPLSISGKFIMTKSEPWLRDSSAALVRPGILLLSALLPLA